VETALVSRPSVVATASAAKSITIFFLIQATPITECIGKGYRIPVSIEITILTDEVPVPKMHKLPPRMAANFALATNALAILRLKRNSKPLIIFIH
jgi:hypothetical protein